VGGFEFLLTTGTDNVKGNPPFAKGGRRAGHPQIQRQTQKHKQDKKPQDELPEWYYRRRGVVN
jgi:hypothetical protein